MDETPKRRMSKGCLITLIVALVILVIIIALAITCYVYREDIARKGTSMVIATVKVKVMENPVEVVDTVQFNALTDEFIMKLEAGELDPAVYQSVMLVMQSLMDTDTLTAADVEMAVNAMIDQFPELEDMRPLPSAPDTLEVEDTVLVE
jgi:hypothetical protein